MRSARFTTRLFERTPGVFDSVPGLFESVPGLFESVPGLFESRPTCVEARVTRLTRCLAALLLCSLLATPASAQQTNAKVVPVSVSGDPAARFSLVVMGDGYTAAEMPKYRAQLDKHLNVLWSIEPFRSYRNYINVYSVEITSGESGITCDPEVRQQKTTPLRAHFQGGCTNPNARGILVDQNLAREFARQATPHFDQILVLANTTTYGGIGGAVATTSGGNSLGVLITPHELGHSLGRLQDEYTYRERGVAGGPYKGTEPPSVHHTLLSEDQMRAEQKKWFRWLGEESESGGKIGRFEGGQYTTAGIWRPSKHSMMISIGYYFDQVSRERMVERISEQVQLIAGSTPTGEPVGTDDYIWIETAHPNSHALQIRWEADGVPFPAASGRRVFPLFFYMDSMPGLGPNVQQVRVTVTDLTPFVRDPATRQKVLTATRTWKITRSARRSADNTIAFTHSTATDRPVRGDEVVVVHTTHPARPAVVDWQLNGAGVQQAGLTDGMLDLSTLRLKPGTHTLTAEVRGWDSKAASDRRTWTIDNTPPEVKYTLSSPLETRKESDGTPHYVFREEFTMRLDPSDDQKGYVVAEFRVNGDGWHHYYGWPDAPEGTPFKFTPRGTTIKELVYGSLSSEGLSPQPWEERKPGYGTHRIEYRAIDAAGNIGPARAFMVTVQPAK